MKKWLQGELNKMGKEISLFTNFTKKENRITNYCGLVLRVLYKESPDAFEDAIVRLTSNSSVDFTCLPRFEQQTSKGNSIPDLCISKEHLIFTLRSKTRLVLQKSSSEAYR